MDIYCLRLRQLAGLTVTMFFLLQLLFYFLLPWLLILCKKKKKTKEKSKEEVKKSKEIVKTTAKPKKEVLKEEEKSKKEVKQPMEEDDKSKEIDKPKEEVKNSKEGDEMKLKKEATQPAEEMEKLKMSKEQEEEWAKAINEEDKRKIVGWPIFKISVEKEINDWTFEEQVDYLRKMTNYIELMKFLRLADDVMQAYVDFMTAMTKVIRPLYLEHKCRNPVKDKNSKEKCLFCGYYIYWAQCHYGLNTYKPSYYRCPVWIVELIREDLYNYGGLLKIIERNPFFLEFKKSKQLAKKREKKKEHEQAAGGGGQYEALFGEDGANGFTEQKKAKEPSKEKTKDQSKPEEHYESLFDEPLLLTQETQSSREEGHHD